MFAPALSGKDTATLERRWDMYVGIGTLLLIILIVLLVLYVF